MKNVEDFLTNPEFIRWVSSPDKELEAYWREWGKANPEQLSNIRIAKELVLRTRFNRSIPTEGLKEELLQSVLRQRAHSPAPLKHTPKKTFTLNGFWLGLGQMNRVAAILIFCLGLVWLFSPQHDTQEPLEPIAKTTLVVKATNPGERLQLTFGDGSKVWLNSSSELVFPENFAADSREVQLSGEAYFEVAKDGKRPFIVSTDGLITRVIGTSFNIDTKDSKSTHISLLSGKVEVKSPRAEVTLSPGEMMTYDQIKNQHQIVSFDPKKVLAWKYGVLRFSRATLNEVKASLEEWYGVQVRLHNVSGVDWQFSGEYQRQTLEEVLESMSYIQDFQFQIANDIVTIKF